MRRMDRYNDENSNEKLSRSNKNRELYQNVGTNTRYTNLTDVTNANAIDITNTNTEYKTREDYQKMKKYNSDLPTPKVKKDLDDFNNFYRQENRVYDINNVLEEARKNRQEDELEEKRKLKNTSYNILANLNTEELEKYRQEKRDRLTKGEDELRGLIDTIASKTLAGELEAASDLLSDLMATSILDKVDKPIPDKKLDLDALSLEEEPVKVVIEREEIVVEDNDDCDEETDEEDTIIENKVLNKEKIEQIRKLNAELDAKEETEEVVETKNQEEQEATEETEDKSKDEDFYTRSMDLSEKDFDLEEEFKDKTVPMFVKILILVILAAAVAISMYFFN